MYDRYCNRDIIHYRMHETQHISISRMAYNVESIMSYTIFTIYIYKSLQCKSHNAL